MSIDFNSLLNMSKNEEVKRWVNVNLRNYVQKAEIKPEFVECEHIVDYLNSKVAPKRLMKMSFDQAKSNSEKWVKALIKKGNNILETEVDLETVLDFGNGFKLVKLLTENAYKREGNLMRHCVGGYFNNSGVSIYSLRDSENQPHCTIELQGSGDSINQVKGKGNGCIHPKYVEYVLRSLEHLGNKVRLSEMSYLGYHEMSKEQWDFITKHFTGEKFLMVEGKKLFFQGSNLKRK